MNSDPTAIRGITTGAATVVQLEIAGDFPGSPVNLHHHHFTVVGDRTAALTICP